MFLVRHAFHAAITAALIFSSACSVPTAEIPDEGAVGAIQLSLTQATADARCLRIAVQGATSAQRSVNLTAGQSTTLAFPGLPVGTVSITAQAFAVICTSVTPETPTTWVTANPVPAMIRPAMTTQLALTLLRSGGIAIAVSFVEPTDGGASDPDGFSNDLGLSSDLALSSDLGSPTKGDVQSGVDTNAPSPADGGSPGSDTSLPSDAPFFTDSAPQTGDDGPNAPSDSISSADGPQRTALMVVGQIPLSPGDKAVSDRLQFNLGFSVGAIAAAGLTPDRAVGYALVFVSESVTSSDVGTKLTGLTAPILNGEPALQDELGMTGATFGTDQGTDAMMTQVLVTNAASPLAAGLSGTVTIVSSPANFAWGIPNAQATRVAQVSGSTGKSCIYAYETGASMVGGTAAGRRGMFPATSAAGALLNANGWAFFDASVAWLTRP